MSPGDAVDGSIIHLVGEKAVKAGKLVSLFCALAVTVTSLIGAPWPVNVDTVSAEGATLVLSVPYIWEDVLTSDLLTTFEAQHGGVDVQVVFSETAFFGFGPAGAIEDQLDATEERVTAADVLYVDSSTLSVADTQAGYYLNLAPLAMSDPALDTADFIPAAWQSFQWDDGLWALPLSVDVILVTYDPAAFDEVGLAYPNERWTIDDFAYAARALAQYNADGTVATPGLSTVAGGNNQAVFLRALAGSGFYDTASVPNAPSFANPNLEYLLQTWYELVSEGVVLAQGGGREETIPLRVEGINGYAERSFGRSDDANTVRYASLLPGGVAGLNVQGFAVSAGTQYPELAYALASFLTGRPELATNAFSAVPARYSLADSQTAASASANDPMGGPGMPGGPFGGARTVPETIRPVLQQGLTSALPVAELRYASYLSVALSEMLSSGTDALSALQAAEAQAYSDMQTAMARADTVSLMVIPPAPAPTLAPGEIALTCAVNTGFGGPMRGGQLFNQDEWDRLIASFVVNDPEVGLVTLEAVQENDLAALAEQYDCFILSGNVVEGSDLSPLVNLDPLLDTDSTFDRNDIMGNTLSQLQRDNKTWGIPLAIQPQMLQYDLQRFAQAGVPEPTNGWTVDVFVDALRRLKPYDTDPAPFVPADPSGSYLLMLIAAFGGLPLDYRTDPPTVNFTDTDTVEAIRQVLDLAVQGYISYSQQATFAVTVGVGDAAPAITTNTLNQFRPPMPGGAGASQSSAALTTYPQGSRYNAVAYEITAGYISATAQNPEAAYRFLSEVARTPQLFSGMPARASLVSDPAVIAAQGANVVAVYQQLDALLRAPNTIVFPTFGAGRGGGELTMAVSYWLRRAFDRYVQEGADLETELAEAEQLTLAYLECTQGIAIDQSVDTPEQRFQQFEALRQCATSVDPEFGQG